MERKALDSKPKKTRAIYWKGSGEPVPVLLAALKNLESTIELVAESENIDAVSDPQNVNFIIVDLFGDESATSNKLLTLSSAANLFETSGILLLGKVPDDRLASLCRKYSKLEVLIPPLSKDRINSIKWLSGKADSSRPAAVKNIVSFLRLESVYGGGTFALADSKSHFKIPAISNFPRLTAVFERIWQSSPTSALRGQRVAASATSLAKGIGLSEKKQTDLAQAAFFLHGLSGENNEENYNHDFDFFRSPDKTKLSELSETYRSTSVIVANELGLPDAARYISELSDHLKRASKSNGPATISNSVGCLLIPELAERSIWQNGRWDRYALSRIMRKLLDSSLFSFSANLISTFGRIVVEAFGMRLLVHPEPVKLYESKLPFSEELIREEEDQAKRNLNGRKVKLVTVKDLQSGMKVLAPITTQDGALLLRSEIVLDEGVISCLKNLDAVRPVQGPISVEQV